MPKIEGAPKQFEQTRISENPARKTFLRKTRMQRRTHIAHAHFAPSYFRHNVFGGVDDVLEMLWDFSESRGLGVKGMTKLVGFVFQITPGAENRRSPETIGTNRNFRNTR